MTGDELYIYIWWNVIWYVYSKKLYWFCSICFFIQKKVLFVLTYGFNRRCACVYFFSTSMGLIRELLNNFYLFWFHLKICATEKLISQFLQRCTHLNKFMGLANVNNLLFYYFPFSNTINYLCAICINMSSMSVTWNLILNKWMDGFTIAENLNEAEIF